MNPVLDSQPAFNNRQASYRLIEWEGRTCIEYRMPGDQPYPGEVLEAVRTVQAHPSAHLPEIFHIEERRVIAEYLDGYVPLSKAGVTSSRFNLFGAAPRKFKRRHLRADQRDMAAHFDAFIGQLRELGIYLKARGLWHDDVIPQNVMWNRRTHQMKLIDICALCPIESVRAGRRTWYGDGRTDGVYNPDGEVNVDYVRKVFLQDLDPWPVVLARKLGFGIRK